MVDKSDSSAEACHKAYHLQAETSKFGSNTGVSTHTLPEKHLL
jgi:hypothetical protein